MVICRVPPACLVTTAASWRQLPLRLRQLLLAMGTQPHRCLLHRRHPTAPEPPRPCSSFTNSILPPLLPRPRLRLRRLLGQARCLRAHRPGYLCRPICIRAHLPVSATTENLYEKLWWLLVRLLDQMLNTDKNLRKYVVGTRNSK